LKNLKSKFKKVQIMGKIKRFFEYVNKDPVLALISFWVIIFPSAIIAVLIVVVITPQLIAGLIGIEARNKGAILLITFSEIAVIIYFTVMYRIRKLKDAERKENLDKLPNDNLQF